MAVLNQEIYIGSVTSPLFHFDKDHMSEPSSIQSVDLIEETLPIDTFTPTVYYDGTSYETLRTLPFGTPVWYYTSGVLTYKFYIKSVERVTRNGFKLNCISAIGLLDKSYHAGGVYYGRSFASLVREVISDYYADTAPEESTITYNGVTMTSRNQYVTFNGTSTGAFILSFGPESELTVWQSANTYLSQGAYTLNLSSGSKYQIVLELVSGTIVKNGTTYSPGSTLGSSIIQVNLMKSNASSLNDYLIRAESASSGVMTLSVSASFGLNTWVYSGVTFNNAKFNIFLKNASALPYNMSENVGNTKIFGWLPYDTKRNNLHQMMFATNASLLKDENGDMYFDFIKSTSPTTIDDDRIYINGSVEYPAIPSQINLTEHSYQYDNNIEPINVIDNTSTTGDQNGFYVFNDAPIVVETLQASEGITILQANENYAVINGIGVVTGVPYFDRTTVISRSYSSNGEDYTVSIKDATLVTSVNSDYVADRLLGYYTSARTVKGNIKLLREKTGGRYAFKDAFGDAAVGFLKKMTLYPSSFIKADCEFIVGYSASRFGNVYEYHLAIEQPGTLIVPSGTQRMLVTMIGGGSGGSSGFAAEDPEIDWIDNPYDCYKTQTAGKGGQPGEPGLGGKIYRVLISNPAAGNWPVVLGLGGAGGDENTSFEENNEGEIGNDSSLRAPNGTTYSTSNTSAYRSEYGIMDLFTGTVYGRKGHIGCKGGNGGRGNTNGAGDNGEDVTFNGITHYGGEGGDGVNFSFKRTDRSVFAGGAGGSGAQAFADGENGGNARLTLYSDMTSSYERQGYKIAEAVGIVGGWPVTVEPVYGYFQHSPGDGGDGGHGGAGRGGYGGADSFIDAYTDTDDKKVWLNAASTGGGYIAAFSSPGLAAGDGRQGAMFIYSDKPLTFVVKYLLVPTLTNTTNPSTASRVTFTIKNANANDTVEIQRRGITENRWTAIGRGIYSTAGTNHSYTDANAESNRSYEYRAVSLGLGAAVDSEYSNSIVVGYGGPKLVAPVPIASSMYYGIHLEWSAVENATSYVIAAKPEGDYDWSYTVTDKLYSDLFDKGGERYYFKVLAHREDGTYIASNWSSTVSTLTPFSGKVITPVITEGYYTETGGFYVGVGLMIKWDPAYGSCADEYRIERKLHTDTEWDIVTTFDDPGFGSYYDEFTVQSRQQWDYRVKGYRDGWIESDYSEVFTITVDRSLPSPTFVSLGDSGLDVVGLTVSAADIDGRSHYIVWEVSVNGSEWVVEYRTQVGNGQIDPAPTFTSTLSGPHIAVGGFIKVRCYVTAPNYSNSNPSNELSITVKEREYFFTSDTARAEDPSGKTGGWQAAACKWNNTDQYQAMPTVNATSTSAGRSVTVSSNNGTGIYRTINEIDLSQYSKVCLIGEVRKPASTARAAFGAWSNDYGGYGFVSVTNNAYYLAYQIGAAYGILENPKITNPSYTASLGFAVTGGAEYSTYGECYMTDLFGIKK